MSIIKLPLLGVVTSMHSFISFERCPAKIICITRVDGKGILTHKSISTMCFLHLQEIRYEKQAAGAQGVQPCLLTYLRFYELSDGLWGIDKTDVDSIRPLSSLILSEGGMHLKECYFHWRHEITLWPNF